VSGSAMIRYPLGARSWVFRPRNCRCSAGDPAGRRGRSDWTAVERERDISVSSAVMSFEHKRLAFNLLDTPGYPDLLQSVSTQDVRPYAFWIRSKEHVQYADRLGTNVW
jgi:hypothetical protein